MESQGQGLPPFSWLLSSCTHIGFLPVRSLPLLCLRIVAAASLRSCFCLPVCFLQCVPLPPRLWPHCQCLLLEKLLWVPHGADAHASPHHGLCLRLFTKMPIPKSPEQWEEVISPPPWDTVYHLSSEAIHLGLYSKATHENIDFSFSVHIFSRLCQGLCACFLLHPHFSHSGHASLLLSSSTPNQCLHAGLMEKHCPGGPAPLSDLLGFQFGFKLGHGNI